jgi:putative spermidine/putrescine transport system permease protein
MTSGRFATAILNIWVVLVLLFIFAPIIVVLGASVTDGTVISFPPKGFTLEWYATAIKHGEVFDSLRTSFVVAAFTSLCATVLGVPAALALVRYNFAGKAVVSNLFTLPLIFPVVMLGVVLLQWLQIIGLARGTVTLVIGHTLLTVPYVVRLAMSSLAGIDARLERAAMNLGATPMQAFRRVTLPLASTGIVAGAAIAFIVSFDDVTMAVFLSSAREMTLPVRLYSYVQESFTPQIAATSGIMILITIAFIVIIERLVGVAKVFGR